MSRKSARVTLVGLSALFLLPLMGAWLMYTGVIDWQPGETRNHGTLVNPPLAAKLPQDAGERDLTGHWMLLYPANAVCSDTCKQDLVGLRQLRRALGRDGERIRVVVLTEGGASEEPGRTIVEIDEAASLLSDSSGMLRAQLQDLHGGQGTYLLDPLDNIMMHYDAGTDTNDIRLDLERLLKYAKTDPQK